MNILVIVPTYNERGNIDTLIRAVLKSESPHGISLLVVDDNSPDGTAGVVGKLMGDPSVRDRLFLLNREKKDGLARAYVAGLSWGLEREFDLFMKMDADLSQDPIYLPLLIEESRRFDFVIGSRYVRGGVVANWALLRRLVSRGGSLFSRIVLGSGIRDLTGGFLVIGAMAAMAPPASRLVGRSSSTSRCSTTVGGCIRTWDTSRRTSLNGRRAEKRPDELGQEEPAKNDARGGP